MKETVVTLVSQPPSTSLRFHRCVSVLWLPISLCLECASETRVSGLDKNIITCDPSRSSSSSAPVKDGGRHSLDAASGFERRMLHELLKNPFVPVRSLRGVFPASTEYYREDALIEMRIDVASDVSSIAASPWAEMEAHKSVAAVIAVLNCHDHEPCQALAALKLVFQRYFKECTCRCIVLDPTADAQASMSHHIFLLAHASTPVQEVAQHLLMEIALPVVQQANASIISLTSSVGTVSPATQPASEGIDKVSGGGDEVVNGRIVHSRLAKKKGDLLLRLGALDAALLAYHESLPDADAMWCSATLEALAALRYLQRPPMLDVTTVVENIFSSLESDETVWNAEMSTTLKQLETVVESVRADQRRATLLLKHSLPAAPLNRRLLKEVEEPLSIQIENFRRQIAIIHRYFKGDNKEAMGTHVEDAGKNAREAFKEIFRLSFMELQLYLQEALQQIRSITTGSRAGLKEREANIHLKRTELLAEEGDKRKFLESLTVLKASAKNTPESMQQDLRKQIPYLSSLCGCWRKAIFNVVEAAVSERQANAHGASIALLMRACRMAGIPLPLMEFQDQAAEWKEVAAIEIRGCDTVSGGVGEAGSTAQRVHKAQDVPLLMKLLDAVTEAGLDNGIQSVVASLLLFEYYPILRRETQELLLEILERSNAAIESLVVVPPPLLQGMEVLPLPPHLAPKTAPLSGAQFTFIDTGRLKMTMLTLNGNVLPHGQVVWAVGTVGEVQLVLRNPFRRDLQLTSIALRCRSVETLDDLGRIGDGTAGHMVGPLAPSSYLVTGLILPSMSQRLLRLQVEPNMRGYLAVDGVEIRLGKLPLCATFLMPSPNPIIIPVLQQLPDITCTLGVNEVEIFGGQTIHFPLYLTNSGVVTIHKLHLTAHDESCQLDSCTGCKERVNSTSLYVTLESDAFQQKGTSRCLEPGDTLLVHVTMIAPACSDHVVFQRVVFRATIELSYDAPEAPENVPSAVPVFAVIPRRLQETFLRVFQVPSVSVTSLKLSRDRRCVEITVKNKSELYTIEILCSRLLFTSIPDALIVAGAEYLIPPIEITKIPANVRQLLLPWVVRELPECRGELALDLSILANVLVSMEPLEDAVVRVMCVSGDESGGAAFKDQWRSGHAVTSEFPLRFSVMQPVTLLVRVSAPWRQAVPLRVRLSMENHLDADVLSGPVDTTSLVGGGTKTVASPRHSSEKNEEEHDDGKSYEECIEFFPFKVGEHVLTITLSDLDGREITHMVKLQVEHL
ncbi:hypothetical protein TraAM80_00560 [Trypanosoma rangeli]|uniref:Uncharacterized protein n=1 Tax=Trypanosoma rangeli TaxID=5698 RepID=A0A422P2P7_TRYRA|nr:uncharacterized protein TraAM80_00560 [Trypanosoma rangeli]RNF12000.1 hypothetical protein TraAM80_00560 [Trypanosoma rangeli]|eukprot:RNF12000.1 hypothetical protein TraAM80_00560 [Trypanosoma rangeli]